MLLQSKSNETSRKNQFGYLIDLNFVQRNVINEINRTAYHQHYLLLVLTSRGLSSAEFDFWLLPSVS